MARRLWCLECTYTVTDKGEDVGWITFIKYHDEGTGFNGNEWLIQDCSSGFPFSKTDRTAENAHRKLRQNGLGFKRGEVKKKYLYYNENDT